MVYRILVPRPGIKPMPSALEMWCLNHWSIREVPLNLEVVTYWVIQFQMNIFSIFETHW